MFQKLLTLVCIMLIPAFAFGYPDNCQFDDTIVVRDYDVHNGYNGGPINTNLTLTANNLYVLVGHVYVEEGCKITIEPGTVIWGTNPEDPTYGPDTLNPGALIIARGGIIDAEGTVDDPIIFTAVGDDVCDPDDFGYNDRQLWGGIIILGYADINTADSTGHIEGIPVGEPRADYGSDIPNDEDSSGVLQYISLRHGGHEIGDANEINGFTFGAIGSKTVCDHLEVFANYDDGYEWFGGNMNCSHLIAAYTGDDCFDMDEGIRGNFQFLFAMYTDSAGDKNGEHDGGTDPESGLPYAHPVVYNATFIGRGSNPDLCNGATSTFHIRDNWGGEYHNSIFTEASCYGIFEIENLDAGYSNPSVVDSEQRLRTGDIKFGYNMWYGHGSVMADYVNPAPPKVDYQHVLDYFNGVGDYASGSANETGPTNDFGIDPMLVSLSWRDGNHGELDPRLQTGSPAKGGAMDSYPSDPFFTTVDYKGAFDLYSSNPCDFWLGRWTYLAEKGIVPGMKCGDANASGGVNILDATYIITYLYKSGPAPKPWQVIGDVNHSGGVNILDATYLINYLYKSGPAPDCCP
nr:dockerin type I repeat-containing protein [candidate division Zixibacteria bacterium]